MAKTSERRLAIELRKKGYSYNEIKNKIKVAKSSLSLWLKPFPLTKNQLTRLKNKKYKAIERFRETMKEKRVKRFQGYFNDFKKILPFSKKELLTAGYFLYWGEGNKVSRNAISINNTDPAVLKFALFWMIKSLKIPKTKIKIYLHLYKDMNINKEIDYWSKSLKISKKQFIKPYIKDSNKKEIDQKGFGHGTCAVVVHNTVIKEKILAGLSCVAEYYSKKL